MIIARVARSFRQHDWFTAAVELVLLSAGLFVGFQLDRWNDERLDQQKANEYREQLIADLTVERDDVDQLTAYHEQVQKYAMTALTAWSETPAANPQELIVALYQASNVIPVTSVRGAYDALSNNGLIDLVADPALASRLSGYYGQQLSIFFTEVKRYRLELRGVMPVYVQTRIRDNCTQISAAQRIMEELRADCDLGLEQAEAEQILADIVAHPEMRAYLRQGISRDGISIQVLHSKRSFIEDLLADLQALGQRP
ncbi:hypothetical protein NOR53_3481 [gamma proteobacterium NOR5-3]|nr:hypothetical protein NOR53_3481 [gamma proteobacterium NOR5-3]